MYVKGSIAAKDQYRYLDAFQDATFLSLSHTIPTFNNPEERAF